MIIIIWQIILLEMYGKFYIRDMFGFENEFAYTNPLLMFKNKSNLFIFIYIISLSLPFWVLMPLIGDGLGFFFPYFSLIYTYSLKKYICGLVN